MVAVESKIINDKLVVKLSVMEADMLNRGATLTAPNPGADNYAAQIQVRPLTDHDPNYVPIPMEKFMTKPYIERYNTEKALARIFLTGDLQIFVPPEIPMHTRRTSLDIKPIEVDTPDRQEDGTSGLGSIPTKGINLIIDGDNYGSSLLKK